MKQLAETLWITWITGFDNPLATSVLTTCNRHITNKPLHVMQYVCCNGFDYVHYTHHLHHLMSVDPHQLNLHYSCCLEISLKAVGKQKIYNMRCVWGFFLYVFTKTHDIWHIIVKLVNFRCKNDHFTFAIDDFPKTNIMAKWNQCIKYEQKIQMFV